MNLRRTDLALEAQELWCAAEKDAEGAKVIRRRKGALRAEEVQLTEGPLARAIGKPPGRYVTVDLRRAKLVREEDFDCAATLLAAELRRLMGRGGGSTLVVGLGNRDVTPDSLGPLAIEKTLVTRHIMDSAHSPLDLRSVCAAAPGVLGVTGIETVEIVESLVKKLRPSAVICIDSLAARDSNRIGCTLQLTNTGIQPGSGVGNHRKPLTKATLGVDVIALGVPTVVYAATLARDAFSMIADTPDEEKLTQMETDLFGTELGNLIVTPRDIDSIVKNCAAMIASGINHALQPSLSSAQIAQMMD